MLEICFCVAESRVIPTAMPLIISSASFMVSAVSRRPSAESSMSLALSY